MNDPINVVGTEDCGRMLSRRWRERRPATLLLGKSLKGFKSLLRRCHKSVTFVSRGTDTRP
jgi:hypothetical protein